MIEVTEKELASYGIRIRRMDCRFESAGKLSGRRVISESLTYSPREVEYLNRLISDSLQDYIGENPDSIYYAGFVDKLYDDVSHLLARKSNSHSIHRILRDFKELLDDNEEKAYPYEHFANDVRRFLRNQIEDPESEKEDVKVFEKALEKFEKRGARG